MNSGVVKYLEEQTQRLETVEEALFRIAESCERNTDAINSVASAIKELRGDLVDAATSKDRVPSVLFVYFICIFGTLFAIDKLTNSRTNLHANQRGVHIEQIP